jgi:cell division protein FtsQ
LQQITGMQGFWRRAQQAPTLKAEAVPSFESSPTISRISRPGPRRPATALKIPRGERRIKRSRRTTRRWMIYGLAASTVLSAVGGVAYALYANHVTLTDIVRTADADANALMIAAGFGINQVNLSGQHFASDNDIYDALDLTNVKTFAAFDSEAVLKRIERIPWIDKVQMTRVYPGTLDVVVRERTPALIWRRGNENYLVDASGRVLGPMPATSSWALPRVVGEGAKDDANLMLTAVKRYPAIQSQFAYGQRVGERRWRVVLKNGTMLELAADREIEGLQEIARAPAVVPALKGTPMVVDVRTPGRITMRPIDSKLARLTTPGTSTGAQLTVSSR